MKACLPRGAGFPSRSPPTPFGTFILAVPSPCWSPSCANPSGVWRVLHIFFPLRGRGIPLSSQEWLLPLPSESSCRWSFCALIRFPRCHSFRPVEVEFSPLFCPRPGSSPDVGPLTGDGRLRTSSPPGMTRRRWTTQSRFLQPVPCSSFRAGSCFGASFVAVTKTGIPFLPLTSPRMIHGLFLHTFFLPMAVAEETPPRFPLLGGT